MKTQFESMLLNQNKIIENETLQNYEMNVRISMLRKMLRVYKVKNKIIYKSLHREYMELIR
jgi:hypothetical protein